MNYEVLRGYSVLGSTEDTGVLPIQSALVMVKSVPYSRVFLGCGLGITEEQVYQKVAGFGDELSFEFIEKLYFKMKEERGKNGH